MPCSSSAFWTFQHESMSLWMKVNGQRWSLIFGIAVASHLMTDLASLDATAQADLVRSGEASPAELVDAAIARIEALNPQLNAVIHPLFEKAREAAAGNVPDGPFRGVPFMLKDLAA